jgi:hypothetical protein
VGMGGFVRYRIVRSILNGINLPILTNIDRSVPTQKVSNRADERMTGTWRRSTYPARWAPLRGGDFLGLEWNNRPLKKIFRK